MYVSTETRVCVSWQAQQLEIQCDTESSQIHGDRKQNEGEIKTQGNRKWRQVKLKETGTGVQMTLKTGSEVQVKSMEIGSGV